uniref:Glycosyltransferase 14 family member n=1 Tax=Echinococcus granulosus TaxID=6210 RepID=A0A068WUG4_ECHGR|nr:glycosyltransferase 14 family member [Echinococcus granulosus]
MQLSLRMDRNHDTALLQDSPRQLDPRCLKGDMADSYRILLHFALAVLIVGSLVILWYYFFTVPFGRFVSPIIVLSGADVGGYDKGTAFAFFSSIDSPEHRNCRFYLDRFPIKRFGDGDMDIAYTIAVENDVRPVARILRMIYRENNYYCIHLNRKANSTLYTAMKGLLTCFRKNVELVEKNSSFAVTRGDESVLQAQLVCAEQALKRNKRWKYLINIDDDEFPLRTNLETVAILKALNGSNLVEAFSTNSLKPKVGNKTLPLEVTWYKGASHGAYRREFLQEAVLGQAVAPIRQYLLEHQSFPNPEEYFFPILTYNSKLRLPGACVTAPSPNTEVKFGFLAEICIREDYGVRCMTKYDRSVCLLGNEHLPMLKEASHLFASKFDPNYEPDAYTNLEKWYFDRIKDEMEAGLMPRPAYDTYIYSTLSCSQRHI